MTVVFNTNYKRPPNVVFISVEPSLTSQQFKDEADVNYLIQRYKATGTFYDALNTAGRLKRMPQFGDFAGIGDFAEQQAKILEVYDLFNSLPAEMRARFGHNPAAYVEFVGNPANTKQAIEMGLLSKPVETPAMPVETPATPGVNAPVNPVNPEVKPTAE